MGAGFDGNINSGTTESQVGRLPAGVLILSGQAGVRQSDTFGTLAAGLQRVYPIAPGVALYGGGQFSGRYNARGNNDLFNQYQFGVRGGLSVLQGRNLFRAGTDLSKVSVGGQLYLSLATLVGEWQYQNHQFNRFGLAVQLTDQSYKNIDVFLNTAKTIKIASGADARDNLLTNMTVSWHRSLAHPWSPEFAVALNVGDDKKKKSRPDLSR